MQPLSQTITIEKANHTDLEKYLVPAFTRTFEREKQSPEFSRDEDQITKQRLYFNINENQLTDRRYDILTAFLEQIAQELRLGESEQVCFGEAYNANGIGNNVRLPIIIKTANREIHFGYLHANHDLLRSIKHFCLTDNNNERLNVPVYDLIATR